MRKSTKTWAKLKSCNSLWSLSDIEKSHRVRCLCCFNPDTGVKYYGDGGPPIGLMPDLEFETFNVTLKKGDRLFLYSDGVTECQNAAGDLLDEDGLEQILLKHNSGSGPEFMNDLMWELTAFADEMPFGDDVSGILFEFKDFTNAD